MITNYLIELLKDNECVIITEFGAFISKRHSATIDYANHRFMPPYKEIVFNSKLTNNDNLLVDFISQKENISAEESLNKINNFVNQSEAILDVNHELDLKDFGKIRKFGSDYVFTTNDNANLLGDSFGLSDFVIQPVFRTETYQIIKEKIVVEQKAKNTEYSMAIESVEDAPEENTRRKPYLLRTFTFTTLVFLLFFAINWTTDRSSSNLASWNPFLYSSPNEFLISKLDSKEAKVQDIEVAEISEKAAVEVEVQDIEVAEISEETAVEVEVQDIEVAETSEETAVEVEVQDIEVAETSEKAAVEVEYHYFIVGGSFQAFESAEKFLNKIKGQGFDNASLLEKNDNGYIRVYYESFVERSEALPRLEVIKNEYDKSAWLLFQK